MNYFKKFGASRILLSRRFVEQVPALKLKTFGHPKNCCNDSNIWTMWFSSWSNASKRCRWKGKPCRLWWQNRVVCPGSSLFAQTCLSEYLGLLWYGKVMLKAVWKQSTSGWLINTVKVSILKEMGPSLCFDRVLFSLLQIIASEVKNQRDQMFILDHLFYRYCRLVVLGPNKQ